MVNPEVAKYIKEWERKGHSEDELRTWLRQNNYSEEHIEEAFFVVQNPPVELQKSKHGLSVSHEKDEIRLTGRKPMTVLLWWFLTLGFYTYYWFIVTTGEIRKNGKQCPSAWLLFVPFLLGIVMVVLLIAQAIIGASESLLTIVIPVAILVSALLSFFAWLYFFWEFCETVKELAKAPVFATFLLLLFAHPVGLMLAQSDLNRFAD